MAKTEDKVLIENALGGDQTAYRELMNRHKTAIYHIIYRIVRDSEIAADLVQETFMKAFTSLAGYRSEYRFSTWLYRIGANCAIDHLRKQRIKTLSLNAASDSVDGQLEYDIPDNSYNPEKDLVNREQKVSIADAIDSLPEKYKIVINYRHRDNKSYDEIADALSIPIGTVKARIFRARELLKKKLKAH
ncbi:MAG: sigma-70 family RNA polymerase sigma factor [Candidatus Zixiibacteriota bacterium]